MPGQKQHRRRHPVHRTNAPERLPDRNTRSTLDECRASRVAAFGRGSNTDKPVRGEENLGVAVSGQYSPLRTICFVR